MSTVLESSAHRRWFHMPSLAVLALAGATAFAAERAVDGWKATRPSPFVTPVVTVVGTAQRRVQPDRLQWSVTLTSSARTRGAVLQELAAQRIAAMQVLRDAGATEAEIWVQPTYHTDLVGGTRGPIVAKAQV